MTGVTVDLHLGDCLDILPTLPPESVDAVITDPPYPCIKRSYGYWTVEEWWAMMMPVVAETRRILKPTGSAVFILQPNSEKVGKMRGWLWEFMAWMCREWNMVQDAWWVNTIPVPIAHCSRKYGLMRPSVKPMVWCGRSDCYRHQDAILMDAARDFATSRNLEDRSRHRFAGGNSMNFSAAARTLQERGGVTPFNAVFCSTGDAGKKAGEYGHGAGTPLKLADWWTRYICPPGGTVADWFMGSGTMGVAAVRNGCSFVGIEKLDEPGYFPTAQERIEAEREKAWQRELAL